MKKITNYLILKMSSYKIVAIFLLIYVYCFCIFSYFIKNTKNYNYYDVVIHEFNYVTLFKFFSPLFLLVLYNLCNNSNFYKYLFVKFKNRHEVYNINVIAVFLSAFVFNIFLNIISILQCIGNISFKNQWSTYFLHPTILSQTKGNLNIIINNFTPLKYIMYFNTLFTLYLFTLGLIFLVINTLFKKRVISFIVSMLLIFLNLSIDSINGFWNNFTFTSNIFFTEHSCNYIILKLIYWILLIFILYFIGYILTKKLDYKFTD